MCYTVDYQMIAKSVRFYNLTLFYLPDYQVIILKGIGFL